MGKQLGLLLLGEGRELALEQVEAREIVPLREVDVLLQLLVACREGLDHLGLALHDL